MGVLNWGDCLYWHLPFLALSDPERGCPRAREARREGGGPGGPHPTLSTCKGEPVRAYLYLINTVERGGFCFLCLVCRIIGEPQLGVMERGGVQIKERSEAKLFNLYGCN